MKIIEYEEKYGTVDNPNFKYVMSKVITNDGCDTTVPSINHGNHSLTIKYEYNDGYYDRYEKEFYGFKTVKTINPDETYQIDTYYTKDGYYAKGAIKESVQYDKDKFVLSKSFTKLCESPRALPEKEENWIYEKTSGNEYIYTSTEYEYDEYGNCTQLTQDFANGEKLKIQSKMLKYIKTDGIEYCSHCSSGNCEGHLKNKYNFIKNIN